MRQAWTTIGRPTQGTIGYQADEASGRHGHLLFDRYPLEILGHYHATRHFRFGGGLRHAIDPRLTGGGVLRGEGVVSWYF